MTEYQYAWTTIGDDETCYDISESDWTKESSLDDCFESMGHESGYIRRTDANGNQEFAVNSCDWNFVSNIEDAVVSPWDVKGSTC